MRRQIFFVLFCLLAASAPGSAHAAMQEQVQRFLASITPPGAQTDYASLEESSDAILVRDIVSHAQSAGGEETVHRIGLLQLRGLTALPSGLFRLDSLRAENIRIDGMSGIDGSGAGSIRIQTVTATDMDGARIKALNLPNLVVVSPDAGFVKAARRYSRALGATLAIANKERTAHDEHAEVLEIIRPLVVRYCRARVGTAERSGLSADDVAQEVCLAAISSCSSACCTGAATPRCRASARRARCRRATCRWASCTTKACRGWWRPASGRRE